MRLAPSQSRSKLYIGNVPKLWSKDRWEEELNKHVRGAACYFTTFLTSLSAAPLPGTVCEQHTAREEAFLTDCKVTAQSERNAAAWRSVREGKRAALWSVAGAASHLPEQVKDSRPHS